MTELNPDPALVAATQAAIDVFITDTLNLVTIIKDFDPTYLSEENIEQIIELMGRAEAIITWFIDGFESVADPLVYYNDDMFDDFVWQFLGDDDPSEVLTMLMDILGTMDTEDTYYKIRSIFQYGIGVMNLRSFEGIQEWVAGLETFGHTQAEFVEYAINLLAIITEDGIDGDEWYDQEMIYFLDQIVYWQGMLDQANLDLADIQLLIDDEVATLDPLLVADAILFWETSVENMKYFRYDVYF
jgi:hypothetical protein